jgi:hypothetical protein
MTDTQRFKIYKAIVKSTERKSEKMTFSEKLAAIHKINYKGK